MTNIAADKKQLLIVTYIFPPSSYVGVYRTLKYCKYINKDRWDLTVIAPKSVPEKKFINYKLLDEVPTNCKVHRTTDISPYSLFSSSNSKLGRFLKKIINKVCSYICIPDSHIFWFPFALVKGIALCRKNKYDIIYSSSPPHSTHIVSLYLAKLFNIKLVVDFRDPWGDEVFYKYNKRTRFTKWFETRQLNNVIKYSNKIITISKGEAIELLNRFPNLNSEIVTHIENGFDPDDFAELNTERKVNSQKRKLTFTYIGSIYEGTTEEFFKGLHILKNTNNEIYNELTINFIGSNTQYINTISNKYDLSDIVEVTEYLPHAECLAKLSSSDMNLILLGGNSFPASEIPAKTYEYLFLKKPIFAVAKKGDLTEILLNSGLGIVIEPNNPDLVAQKIAELVHKNLNNTHVITPNHKYIENFNRASLTKKFTNVLDNTT
ncbi:MAG: glycosyltransferase [Candidatus Thiodiazotropha weberae]|nr:glycosyltransferase [Candidatus Thiodiazotropha lotti]MCG8010165.1 glycosyltransferase [Candidatus Thiodiazotropha lotti]MCG8021638.1 glycosyltransferase [Candidatus Thiodiazotropha lotti]MCW4208807.1 glycosyltransferase [Candidatus Thiodiazotropha lotti]MCW4209623.1 glycosyltransferase [Candidatus Thiodiazotropha lotti]